MFGRLIADRRCAAGLTQEAAARRMGVSQSVWADLEAARREPSLATIRRAAKAINSTVDLLFRRR
jgi:transcriptional regulator with XRE-family HTH domain